MVVVIVTVITLVVGFIVAILTVVIVVRNRRGLGLRNQGVGGNGRRGRVSPRGTVSLAVLLESLTLLHWVATVVEERGVVLLLATDGKVTGVVLIVRLRGG